MNKPFNDEAQSTRARKLATVLTVGVLAGFVLPQAASAQKPNLASGFQVTSSTSASQLVNAILGEGVTAVGAAALVGHADASGAQQGLFSTIGPDILGSGFNKGIVLTSGYASNVTGPNDDSSTTQDWSGDGDPILDTLAGDSTYDANSLTFNFTVNTGVTKLGFNYVFGSEEYNEFVGEFNDSFGFFVDGKNVALLPGTSDPVSINTVNLDANSSLYRDNDPDDFGGTAPINTELDGLTTVLTADVFGALDPNKTVHEIKLVIADTRDNAYDSAVFIQANSFNQDTSPVPEASTMTGFGMGMTALLGMMVVSRRRKMTVRA